MWFPYSMHGFLMRFRFCCVYYTSELYWWKLEENYILPVKDLDDSKYTIDTEWKNDLCNMLVVVTVETSVVWNVAVFWSKRTEVLTMRNWCGTASTVDHVFKNLIRCKPDSGEANSLCAWYLSGDHFVGVHEKLSQNENSWLSTMTAKGKDFTVTLLSSCCSSLCSGKACVHLPRQMPSHLFEAEQSEVLAGAVFSS